MKTIIRVTALVSGLNCEIDACETRATLGEIQEKITKNEIYTQEETKDLFQSSSGMIEEKPREIQPIETNEEVYPNAFYSDDDPWEDSSHISQWIRGKILKKIKFGRHVDLITSEGSFSLSKSGDHVSMYGPTTGNLSGPEYSIDLRSDSYW